jgi:hypothetical protein
MERSELLKRLAQVEQQVLREMDMIARQRKMLTDVGAKEVDTYAMQIMLVGLEDLLVFHLQEREKLCGDLEKLDGST